MTLSASIPKIEPADYSQSQLAASNPAISTPRGHGYDSIRPRHLIVAQVPLAGQIALVVEHAGFFVPVIPFR